MIALYPTANFAAKLAVSNGSRGDAIIIDTFLIAVFCKTIV